MTDFDALRAKLDLIQHHRDVIYTLQREVFAEIRDGGWEQTPRAEQRFQHRLQDGTLGVLDLARDTYKAGKQIGRSSGLAYVVGLVEDGLLREWWPTSQSKLPEGPILIFPPYTEGKLNPQEQYWHRNMPPSREQLSKVMRFDHTERLLFYINSYGVVEYEEILVAPSYFMHYCGRVYARWRIISQLWLGNPYGILELEKAEELLDAIPTNGGEVRKAAEAVVEAAMAVPPESEPKIGNNFEAVKAEREERNPNPFLNRDLEADKRRVAEIRAEIAETQALEDSCVRMAFVLAEHGFTGPFNEATLRRRMRRNRQK